MTVRAKTRTHDLGATSWVTRAECAKPEYDPEDWFPQQKQTEMRHTKAQAICISTCPVRAECFIFACQVRLKQTDLWGIWAGYPAVWFDDRKKVARALKRAKELV